MDNTCGNCKFFDKNKKYVNDCHPCNFHHLTVKSENMGCYKIQFSKIKE